MSPQEAILRACTHRAPDAPRDVGPLADGSYVACCVECWNASVYARRAARKAERAAEAEAGRAYWAARGIAVGERVVAIAGSAFGPAFAMAVTGTAKVGADGAYVSAPHYQRGKLDPDAFGKVTKVCL